MKIQRIEYTSPLQGSDAENDNIDVNVYLQDGSAYALLLATPNNIFWCMENEGTDHFFAYPPPVFVIYLPQKISNVRFMRWSKLTGRSFSRSMG
jgi:hypothetical protein